LELNKERHTLLFFPLRCKGANLWLWPTLCTFTRLSNMPRPAHMATTRPRLPPLYPCLGGHSKLGQNESRHPRPQGRAMKALCLPSTQCASSQGKPSTPMASPMLAIDMVTLLWPRSCVPKQPSRLSLLHFFRPIRHRILTLSSTLDPSLTPVPSFDSHRTPACSHGDHPAVTRPARVSPGFQMHWICLWIPFMMPPPS
jgi:hypothetical protein